MATYMWYALVSTSLRVRGDAEEIDFFCELWWLRNRAVCIDLGISFKFLKISLKNIIVVKSSRNFYVARCMANGSRKRDEGGIRAPNKLYGPGFVMPQPLHPQETYTEAKHRLINRYKNWTDMYRTCHEPMLASYGHAKGYSKLYTIHVIVGTLADAQGSEP